MGASAASWSALLPAGLSQRCTNLADSGVNHCEEQLTGVLPSGDLDHLAHSTAGGLGLGKLELAVLCGDLGELRDHLEERGFVLAAEQPGLVDRGGEQLVGCPVLRSRCLA